MGKADKVGKAGKKGKPDKPRSYAPDFKREAVRLVLEEGRGIREVELSLGITCGLLGYWVLAQRICDGEALGGGVSMSAAGTDAERIEELRRENARIRMECDILRKAMGLQ